MSTRTFMLIVAIGSAITFLYEFAVNLKMF